MALDLLLTCLVPLSSHHALMERSYASASMYTRGTGTAASSGAGDNSPMRQRLWTMLFLGAGGEVGRLTTLLPLVRLVTGGRTIS